MMMTGGCYSEFKHAYSKPAARRRTESETDSLWEKPSKEVPNTLLRRIRMFVSSPGREDKGCPKVLSHDEAPKSPARAEARVYGFGFRVRALGL